MSKKIYIVTFLAILFFTAQILAQDIPEEARKHLARGIIAAEIAKTNIDYDEAIFEFQKSIELAPIWSEPYYQLGILQEKLEKYDEACNNLKKYLELATNSENTSTVKDLIYKIEYKKEKANRKTEIISIIINSKNKRTSVRTFGGCRLDKFYLEGNKIKASIVSNIEKYSWANHTVDVDFDGTTLTYKYIDYNCICCPELKNYPCEYEISIEAKVISHTPLKFKVNQVSLQKFGINPNKFTDENEWVFE